METKDAKDELEQLRRGARWDLHRQAEKLLPKVKIFKVKLGLKGDANTRPERMLARGNDARSAVMQALNNWVEARAENLGITEAEAEESITSIVCDFVGEL